jgi:fatty acid desaturase
MFRDQYLWIYFYVIRVVSPFFGHLGESYHSHHLGMHHVEDNMPDDSSSTMRYQRDNWKHFIQYWLRFMVLGWRDTFQYLFHRKLKRFYVPLSWSESLFILGCIVLCFVSLKAALVVFIIPFIFARLVMMLGNWTQHAFVDPGAPKDSLASTFVCINTPYNHKCWNDGYHALHHLRQAAHYTEYPVMFQQLLPEFAKQKTFVFCGVHYLHLFTWLMTKRYDKLAAHLVNINGVFADDAEAIALMRLRTKQFDVNAYREKPKGVPITRKSSLVSH